MKLVVLSAAALALLVPAAAQAQTAPAAPATTATPAAAAKFNLDTPIEVLVADEKAKAVVESNLPGVEAHPYYEQFKAMSLRALQPMSQGKITEEMLVKIEGELAAIK